eukprot:scaffold46493_cov61-Phaeocystis_antarctica.AAC.4
MVLQRLLRIGVISSPAAIDARILEIAQALGARIELIEQRAERVREAEPQLGELLLLTRHQDEEAPEGHAAHVHAQLVLALRVVVGDGEDLGSRDHVDLEVVERARAEGRAQVRGLEQHVLAPHHAALEQLAAEEGEAAVHDIERGAEDGLARREDDRHEVEHQRGDELVIHTLEEVDPLDPRLQRVVGARDLQVLRALEVLAQAELVVDGQLVALHETVEVVHGHLEARVRRPHRREHLRHRGQDLRPAHAAEEHQAGGPVHLVVVARRRGDVAVADGGDRHRGPVDRGRVHAATAHARPTVEAHQIRGVEPVGYVLVRDACAPAAWRLLPPKLGGALRNHRDPVGLLVWAGHDQSRVELEGHIGRREAVAVVHEPRRGKGHASEALAW